MDARQQLMIERWHHTFDLRGLLQPWLQYRVVFNFKANDNYRTTSAVKKTFYGDEHDCTYKQCLSGYVSAIVLDRVKGYQELIKMIEVRKKNQFVWATIYGRSSPESHTFDLTHRHYDHKGRLLEGADIVGDPVIEDIKRYKTLGFQVQRGRLLLMEQPTLLTVNKLPDEDVF